MGEKREFSINRGGRLERTIVGVDGQKHVLPATKQGADGHFTDEGQYRRAIEQAVDENAKNKMVSEFRPDSEEHIREVLEISHRRYEEYLEASRKLQAEKEALEAQEEEEEFDIFSKPHYHALRVTKNKDVMIYEELPLTHPGEAYLFATNIDMEETGVKHHAVVCWKTSCL